MAATPAYISGESTYEVSVFPPAPTTMTYTIRAFGWLFFGMGLVLATLTALTLSGVMPLQISVAGQSLDGTDERLRFLTFWVASTVVGGALLWFSRGRE